jgi:hypothetical protein
VSVVSAMLVVLASAGGSARATSPSSPDVAIAGPNGIFVGGGVIDPTGVSQRVAFDVVSGRTVAAAIRITNPSSVAQTFVVRGSAGGRVFRLAYRDDGSDVTSQVASGGYAVPLGAGAARRIDVSFSAVPTSRAGQRGGFRFRVSNAADPSLLDVARAQVAVAPITVSSLAAHGRMRCVVTFPSRTLHPGYATHLTMAFHNLTGKKQEAYGFGYADVLDLHGNLLGASAYPPSGPPFEQDIPPHGTRSILVYDLRIRWSGTLRVHPVCEGAHDMGSVLFLVARPRPPADDASAITAAVDTPNSPFQACRPGPAGEPNTGAFPPPDGRHIPALPIRCWAEIRHEVGFDVVALNMVSPANAPATTLDESLQTSVPLPGHDNAFAARWSFVVTADGARPYIALGESRSVVGIGKGFDYDLYDGTWKYGGWAVCGSEGFFVWFYGTGISLEFVNACHPSGASGAPPPSLHAERTQPIGDAGYEVRSPPATRSS